MDANECCSVCLAPYSEPVVLIHCKHRFCKICILEWGVDRAARCPLCRAPIMDMIPVSRETMAFSPFYEMGLVVENFFDEDDLVVSSSLGASMIAGVRYGDRICEVDGYTMRSLEELLATVQRVRAEERLCLVSFYIDLTA